MSGINLSVNINKIALIRNSRGGNYPDLIKVAKDCERFGADGITVHPRPDERHVRFEDIPDLKKVIKTELNIEGNPTERFIQLVLENKPHQCTLVPDSPSALTSDSGWDTVKESLFLKPIISELKNAGIRVSIFINADPRMAEGAFEAGADRIELYTGPYAFNYQQDRAGAIMDHVRTAEKAYSLGLGINAGHDLNLDNLNYYAAQVKHLQEVSIGHALVCDALYYGLENVIPMYKQRLAFHTAE